MILIKQAFIKSSFSVGLLLITPAILAQESGVGFPTTGLSTNPSSYRSAEYNNRANNIINAEAAYARGWTGRGSTVLIMDTGINLSHPDLAGKVKYSKDFTNTGLTDRVGHGTHLSGVVAAARNGTGIHGVAFDAQLAVAKIADNSRLLWSNANGAMAWASQYSDVTIANLSANVNYHTSYTAASRQIAPGLWVNTHTAYGGANYYNLERPEALVIPRNMALTVSAGNSNLGYVQNPATFAVATDSAGNLIHGGRILVVGMWNAGLRTIEGAKAGHMCKDFRANVCQDRYRMSDFYILAPGAGVTSTSNTNTGTRNMGGTSQSAAVTAGALAVINQMWPYMTPENQIQVLLRTANKNLPGYRADTHGQGLLDLDRATQPIGAVGLATTGRTGRSQPITPIAIAGGASQTQARLSSITVIDDLQRDFTANLSSVVAQRSLLSNPIALMHQPGQSWSSKLAGLYADQYSGYSLGQLGTNSTISFDNRAFGAQGPSRHQITLTQAAHNPFVQYSGAWGSVSSSSTLEYDYTYQGVSGFWLQAGIGSTSTATTPGLVERISAIQTLHAVAGYSRSDLVIYAGFQPWIIAGTLQLRTPTSVDDQGVMSYQSSRANLTGQNPIAYAGASWKQSLSKAASMKLGLAANQVGDYRAGLSISIGF